MYVYAASTVVNCVTFLLVRSLVIRDVLNIRFVFASVPNNGLNSLFVFGRIA